MESLVYAVSPYAVDVILLPTIIAVFAIACLLLAVIPGDILNRRLAMGILLVEHANALASLATPADLYASI